jgi:putative tryptophan/tyrosine transport system substrate-binding protein
MNSSRKAGMRYKVIAFLLIILTAHLAEAQQAGKIPQIGVLRPDRSADPGSEALMNAFRQGLRKLGYIEGQSIILEQRFADGNLERLPDLAAELVRLKVDVIVTVNVPASQAAKNATKVIPIVFTWVGDPSLLVGSLARPDGNITGLTTFAQDLSAKRLEVLKEALPGISRVAVLYHSPNPIATRIFKEMEDASPRFGVRVYSLGVRSPNELDKAFETVAKERSGALFVLEEAVMASQRMRVLDFSVKSRVPAASFYREFTEAGGLLSYGVDLPDLFRRAAYYVDRILKGTKPGNLPVEQPTKFDFVINLKTAKQIGVTIPQSVLYRADKVIK